MVRVTAVVISTGAVEGLKLHAEAAGKPLQVKVAGPALFVGSTENANCAGVPALTAAEVIVGLMLRLGKMVIDSEAVLLEGVVSPPPETVALTWPVGGASLAKFTLTVMFVNELLPASVSDRVQVRVPSVQLHPVSPVRAEAVRPALNVTTTETVPLEAMLPLLLTKMV